MGFGFPYVREKYIIFKFKCIAKYFLLLDLCKDIYRILSYTGKHSIKVLKAMILSKLVLFAEGDLPCLSTRGMAALPLCFETFSILPAETCRVFKKNILHTFISVPFVLLNNIIKFFHFLIKNSF